MFIGLQEARAAVLVLNNGTGDCIVVLGCTWICRVVGSIPREVSSRVGGVGGRH